jgi:hypothetical protein
VKSKNSPKLSEHAFGEAERKQVNEKLRVCADKSLEEDVINNKSLNADMRYSDNSSVRKRRRIRVVWSP